MCCPGHVSLTTLRRATLTLMMTVAEVDDSEEALLLGSMGLPADVTATMTDEEKQQLLSNLRAAQAEIAATAAAPLWRSPSAEQRETDEASRRGLSMAFIAAARQGCRVLVALNKADIVSAAQLAARRAELEDQLTRIYNEDDDAARIAACGGAGLDEPPETESLPSTIAADLALPEDAHAVSALSTQQLSGTCKPSLPHCSTSAALVLFS